MIRAEMVIRGVPIGGANHPRIMGIVNLSPESFYQGSVVTTEEHLQNRIATMEKQGVHFIDIGGASTAPSKIYGTPRINEKEELERVRYAMENIADSTNIPISVDTTSAIVAEAALDLGAALVNDVSGLREDPRMAMLLANRDVPVIIMARCPDGCASPDFSYLALKRSITIAEGAGIPKENMILDPGIGFGKPPEVDFAILRALSKYTLFRRPLLVGVSRKAFIGHVLEEPNPENRLIGTIAATAIAAANSADIIRTHDIVETSIALKIGNALRLVPPQEKEIEVLHLLEKFDVEQVLEQVGVGEDIRSSLASKGVMLQILLDNVSVSAALIIKQEMLALGGDAAYHYDTIDHAIESTSVLVMGTKKQLGSLVRKLRGMKYFGLDLIGTKIQTVLK